jgi:hypothetical protein
MDRPTARQFGRRLRRLDRADLTRFVAALWAASGWSTSVGDGRVVARRHGSTAERVDIAVATGVAGVGRALPGTVDADLLVAPVGERTSRVLAARVEPEVVDATDLHERLTYAVEADAREHLLETHVPGERPTPSRRVVLSALAASTGAAGAAALSAHGGADPDPSSLVWYDLGGPTPDGGAGADEGTTVPDPPSGNHAVTPTSSSVLSADKLRDCEGGPADRIAQQLGSLMQYLAPGGGSDGDGDGEIEYYRPETTEAFLAAVEAAGDQPIRHAVSASVGRPVDQGPVTHVPATVVTQSKLRVDYEFTLERTSEGCWQTQSAEIVARGRVGE